MNNFYIKKKDFPLKLQKLLQFMQQNARVIILTLDAARAAGLELARPMDALEAAAAASPSSSSFDENESDDSSSSSSSGLNGRATPTSSTERSAALSSVDDDSESGDEEEDEGRSGEKSGSNGRAPTPASSALASSLYDRPAGFAAVALPPPPLSLSGHRSPVTPVERTRGVAATLLLSFLGARLNSAFSLSAFVETVASEYRAGRAAAALLAPLTDEEMASVGADAGLKVVAPSKASSFSSPFERNGSRNTNVGGGSGEGDGAAPATATAGSGAAAAGRALLSQWVSIAYMTMAQMGVPHALSKSPGAQGWAFAGGNGPSSSSSSFENSSSSLSPSEATAEALALDRIVRATLRQLAEEKGAPAAPPSETLEALKREAAAAKASSNASSSPAGAAAASFMSISDPNLASTSSALEVWGMALGLSRACAEHVASKAEEWGLLDGEEEEEEGGESPSSSPDSSPSSSPGSSSSSPSSGPSSSSSSSSEMAAAGE